MSSDNNTNSLAQTPPQHASLTRRQLLQGSVGATALAGVGLMATSEIISAAPSPTDSPDTCSAPPKHPEPVVAKASDMRERYLRAEKLDQGTFNKRVAFNTTVYPHWIGKSDSFWYIRDLNHEGHNEYCLVDAVAKTNEPAFDHQELAKALGRAAGKKVNPKQLPLTDIQIVLRPRELNFRAFGESWVYSSANRKCRKIQQPRKDWNVSPDGKKAVFSRNHNLWLKDLVSGKERALTTDGEEFYRYGASPTIYGRHEAPLNETLWSPDSKIILTHVIDTRDVAIGMPLVEHVPDDGSLRPTVRDPNRRVALPGDPHVETWKFLAIDTSRGDSQWLDLPPLPVRYPPYQGYFNAGCAWWSADGKKAYLIQDRDGGRLGLLMEWHAKTGKVRTLMEDKFRVAGALFPVSHLATPVSPLPETDEVIWFSDRTGWPHLYLYDLKTGKLKNTITTGNWLVRNILHIDTDRRELWIQTAERVKGRNPYYTDICRVNMDTGAVTEVFATDHHYVVADPSGRTTFADREARGVSSGGEFVVTTRSRVDQVPVTLLLDRNGKELMVLETANVSGLPEGWRWPEPVLLKAADGKTDIYGVVFRPTDFDPQKSYPVIDCSYGYLTPVGSFTNNFAGAWHYLGTAAYAELGFIAVMIANRQHDVREAAFSNFTDKSLPELNMADSVAGIKQLADKYPYMDINRVGVAEWTSQPSALTGMLVYPEFYKVGVSLNPKSDARVFAAMSGRHTDEYPAYEKFAKNLKGKLLLMHGMLDDVMPVSMSFRLIEALLEADKRFDMFFFPRLGHAWDGHSIVRGWDYFTRHLLGNEPPEDFQLTTGLDLMSRAGSDDNK